VPRSYWERRRRCSSRKCWPALGVKSPGKRNGQCCELKRGGPDPRLATYQRAQRSRSCASSWTGCRAQETAPPGQRDPASVRWTCSRAKVRQSQWKKTHPEATNLGAVVRSFQHDGAVAELLDETVLALDRWKASARCDLSAFLGHESLLA